MKKIYSLLLITLLSVKLFSQVDMDMETWHNLPFGNLEDPDGWISFNVLSGFGMSQSVFKETLSPYSGLAAAKIVTQKVTAGAGVNPYRPGHLYDTVGMLAMGDASSYSFGKPLPANRPAYLGFASKYSPVGNDSAFVLVFLTKWSAVNHKQDTIATGKYATGVASNVYSFNSIPLNYYSLIVPDTQYVVAFSSVYSHAGANIGSTFYVDAFTWSFPMFSCAATDVTCFGASTGSIAVSPSTGTPPFQYSMDNGVNYQSSNVFTGLGSGTYAIVVKDANNYILSPQNVTITQPAALTIYNSYIINTSCGTSLGSISVFPSGGTLNYNYLWSNGDTTNFNQNLPVGNYSVVVTDANGCVVTSPILTVGTNPINTIPLCMVTVDSSSAHNIIVWEKTGLPSTIDSFRIYRETMTNVYTHIGSVSMDSLSEFHDYGANPNVTSYKYKLGAIDICNDTAVALSDYHNSIHLQYLGFGNLAWSLYQIENAANPVNFYIISRDDTGTGNFLPISSTIPGGNNSYTDINYASYPNARYRVDVTWNISCNPTRTVTTTHSNVIHLGTSVSVSELEQNNAVSISPNPFTNSTTITFANEQKNTSVKVMNVLGECIQQLTTNNKQFTLDLSSFAKGIYFVRIEDENKNVVNKKIVKE